MLNERQQVDQLALLYELSLAIGASHDINENLNTFFHTLVFRKNLIAAGFFRAEINEKSTHLQKIHIEPIIEFENFNFILSKEFAQSISNNKIKIYAEGDSLYPEIQSIFLRKKGYFMIIPILDSELIILHRLDTSFSPLEKSQLLKIIKNFEVMLQGLRSREKLTIEISERQKAEKELQISRLKYKSILDATITCIVQIDKDYKVKYFSPLAEEMLNTEKNKDLGVINFLDLICPHDKDYFLSSIETIEEKGQISFKPFTIIPGEGELFNFYGTGKALVSSTSAGYQLTLIDNTETYKIQQQKERLQNQQLQILDNLPGGFLFENKNGVIINCNITFAQQFGFNSPEEIIGKKTESFMPKPISDFRNSLNAQVIETRIPIQNFIKEIRFDPNQESEWKMFNIYPYVNREGVIKGTIWFSSDVTDVVATREKAIKSEMLFKYIFDNSEQAIFYHNISTGETLSCNEKALELFEIDSISDLHADWHTFIAKKQFNGISKGEFINLVFESFSKNKQYHGVFKGETKKGRQFIGQLTSIKDDSEKDIRVIIFISDITDQYHAQQEMAERKAVYEALIASSFDGIDIFEFDGELDNIGSSNLLVRNEIMKSFFGDSDDVFMQKDDLNRFLPEKQLNEEDSLEFYRNKMKKLFTEKKQSYELVIKNTSEEVLNLNVVNQILQVNDKSILIRIIEDITKRKEHENIIQNQIEELNEKNLELKRYIDSNLQLENFAYIASHDLQAPVRTINSFSSLIKDSAENKLSEKELKFLNIIISSSTNMIALINDLLLFSRVNTQKIKIEKVETETLINHLLSDIQIDIEKKQAEITFSKLPKIITADTGKLKQLFQNLITNAIKFVDEGIIPRIEVGCEDKKMAWQFFVKDNGIGISPEYAEKIFLLFQTLHSNEKYEGTGMGLAICKKIVEQHQGRIWLESQKGSGTTFFFTIPKQKLHEQKSNQIERINS